VRVKVKSTYTQATWVTVGFATYTDVLTRKQGESNEGCATATGNPASVHRKITILEINFSISSTTNLTWHVSTKNSAYQIIAAK
jgi:hypothetical protein